MVTIEGLQLEYQGSVKNVFGSPFDPDFLWFQFTDDYSVFDWGKMPDQIANKGRALTLLGAFIFGQLANSRLWTELPKSTHLRKFNLEYLTQRWQHRSFSGPQGLAKMGLASHFIELSDLNLKPLTASADALVQYAEQDTLLKVLRAQVDRPGARTIFGQNIYFYNQKDVSIASKRLIPLEVVFRFGMGRGSSLSKRLLANPNYMQQFGFAARPNADEWFDYPIIEFFSKLEPKDRFLSWQEASMLSGLDATLFAELVETAVDIALALHHFFAERDLELWDGKLEFVLASKRGNQNNSTKAQILLADSIGPDELRLIYRGKQFSKELIRQYYQGSAWVKAVEKAKAMADKEAGRDWKEICFKDLKESPHPLSPAVKQAVDSLYGVLINHIIGQTMFRSQPTLDELVSSLDSSSLSDDRRH